METTESEMTGETTSEVESIGEVFRSVAEGMGRLVDLILAKARGEDSPATDKPTE